MRALSSAHRSNNTNKFNPQELRNVFTVKVQRSNNTNKFNPQELRDIAKHHHTVQIIQINSILKNLPVGFHLDQVVQIIQINSILKNAKLISVTMMRFK